MRVAWAIFGILLLVSCKKPEGVSERERATETLARYLATEVQPKAVLVLSNPFTQSSARPAEVYEFERAGIAGLKRGFSEKTPVKIAFPELNKEARENPGSIKVDPKTTTPLSFLVAEDAFQKAALENPDCDIIVSLIGLPLNLEAFPAWTKGPQKFALLLPDWRIIGNRQAILSAFRTGRLAAAIGQSARTPFLLITAKNVDQLLADQPDLFPP